MKDILLRLELELARARVSLSERLKDIEKLISLEYLGVGVREARKTMSIEISRLRELIRTLERIKGE